MHYEINVSFQKRHLFGTHKRSITCETDFKKIWELFKKKFPVKEDYELMADFYEDSSIVIAANSEHGTFESFKKSF